MRRYWINFNLKIDEQQQASGQMDVSRERAICGPDDILDIANAVAQSVAKQLGLRPDQRIGVGIISWQRFEDEAIILAGTTPRDGAASLRRT